MYADVVVLTYQPLEPGFFSYKIPEDLKSEIKVGQLVKVPFGKRSPLGIVLKTRTVLVQERSIQKDRLKNIESIVLELPIILPYQIELLKWTAQYYHAPLVNCLEAILPELPSKQLSVHSSPFKENTVNSEPSTVNQTIVLVPNINRIPQSLAKFPDAKNHAIYHNQLKPKERFEVWLKILEGKADYIFGSRSAIFAPCPQLKKIIIFDEHNGAYKDERSPYFDTLTVAEKISVLTNAKLEIVDRAPKITTYVNHKNEIEIPKSNPVKTFIVSMDIERQMGNKSLISALLANFIQRNYRAGGKTLLFLNKKIESGQYFCRSCQNKGFVGKEPKTCPNCGSFDFFFYTTNIFTVAQQLKKVVQITPKLIAVDKPFQPYFSPSPIDISTSFIFYSETFRRYQLVAHLSADSILARADFASSEEFYSQIQSLKDLATENGVLVLQTYNPQNDYLKSAAASNYSSFSEKNLSERKILGYPPYSFLVKFSIRAKNRRSLLINKENLEEKAQDLSSKLSGLKTPDITILGPYSSPSAKTLPNFNIIIKKKIGAYNLEVREQASRQLKEFVDLARPDWQITVEPQSLN